MPPNARTWLTCHASDKIDSLQVDHVPNDVAVDGGVLVVCRHHHGEREVVAPSC